ncbi:RagB/SusD family nutrient uptake outer membrane protein [Bacteroides sp. CAG:633]|uniref:RagB/SusD family nutrient uptake outer membrane protein n=1 Tax=Bacteroides sp. CAG:633 TaxID=1262744 RepID=UPI002582F292|nr:RagB/SusD family nutrient uptake outer membrane protein [Bacteroides sp. CAG:633]
MNQEPENVIPESEIYNDPQLVLSVLSNLYGKVNWGQNNGDYGSYNQLDEANTCYGSPWIIFTEYDRNSWRVRDYGFVRSVNLFLQGIRGSQNIPESDKMSFEAEARFLRAWYYFCSARSLGGMPIVEDNVYTYDPNVPIETYQLPRSTESGIYDYIIDECTQIASYLSDEPTVNAARANKWAALMLKARAAVYAASIANYGNSKTPDLKTDGGEVGIPADKAKGYYELALTTAQQIINESPYKLQISDPNNLGLSFYQAICQKSDNKEVIWALDRSVEDKVTTNFTSWCMPFSMKDGVQGNALGALLNLVEAFENRDGSDPEIKTTDESGNYVFYDSADQPFLNKDARLWGTVIYPSATYRDEPVVLQAGLLMNEGGTWSKKISNLGETLEDGTLITALDGPMATAGEKFNKTGFLVRKFLDETQNAGSETRNSDMWFPRFRFAEALLIAAEASFELGNKSDAAKYINEVRKRGGIKELTAETITFDHIVNEYRVEFAFEDHRWWDLKRWRLAHEVWDNEIGGKTSQMYALFPYRVYAPGDENDGKWVFEKVDSYMAPNPRNFTMKCYYGSIDDGWISNNPKLVKNPYQ